MCFRFGRPAVCMIFARLIDWLVECHASHAGDRMGLPIPIPLARARKKKWYTEGTLLVIYVRHANRFDL